MATEEAQESYDELRFKMVNGDTHTMQTPAGEGKAVLMSFVGPDRWRSVNELTLIQTSQIVSVALLENAHDLGPFVA